MSEPETTEASAADQAPEAPEAPLAALLTLADGLPDIVDTEPALAAHGATYAAESGTVTRVATESFGGMADEGGTAQIEIRASWTPLPSADAGDALDVAPHVEAWGELLCTAAGLEPVPEGVAVMPSRRGQRGTDR